MHKEVMEKVVAAGHPKGEWSAPCEWLPTPGVAADENRNAFTGVVALYPQGVAWFPGPNVDEDPSNSKRKQWTEKTNNIALIHITESNLGTGMDVWTMDDRVLCLQIPPGFAKDVLKVADQLHIRTMT